MTGINNVWINFGRVHQAVILSCMKVYLLWVALQVLRFSTFAPTSTHLWDATLLRATLMLFILMEVGRAYQITEERYVI